MKRIALFLVLFFSFVVAWIFGYSLWGTIWFGTPFFMSVVMLFWMWRLKNVMYRFVLAVGVGLFMESFTIFPFGTYLISYVFSVFVVGGMSLFVSQHSSPWLRAGQGVASLASLLFLIPFIGTFIMFE